MSLPSSRNHRNNRNPCNPLSKRPQKNRNRKNKPKGHYIICEEKEDEGIISIFSTESPFWRDFF